MFDIFLREATCHSNASLVMLVTWPLTTLARCLHHATQVVVMAPGYQSLHELAVAKGVPVLYWLPRLNDRGVPHSFELEDLHEILCEHDRLCPPPHPQVAWLFFLLVWLMVHPIHSFASSLYSKFHLMHFYGFTWPPNRLRLYIALLQISPAYV